MPYTFCPQFFVTKTFWEFIQSVTKSRQKYIVRRKNITKVIRYSKVWPEIASGIANCDNYHTVWQHRLDKNGNNPSQSHALKGFILDICCKTFTTVLLTIESGIENCNSYHRVWQYRLDRIGKNSSHSNALNKKVYFRFKL